MSSKDEFSNELQPIMDGTTESIEAIMFDGMTEEQFVENLLSTNEDHLSSSLSEHQYLVNESGSLLDEKEGSVSFSYFIIVTYAHN